MSLFETRVQSLRPLFEEGARPIEAPRAELPPSKAHAGLILQNEARCELGGPGHASALALLYTNSKAKDCAPGRTPDGGVAIFSRRYFYS